MTRRRGHGGGRAFRATAVALVAGLVMAVVAAAPASAQANDDRANAAVVSEPLPFTDSLDTSTATGDADDPGCVSTPGDTANPTVWYSYTPSADGFVQANTFGSSYDTTVGAYVVDDSTGQLIELACNDDAGGQQSRVDVEAVTGETILFMVGAFAGQPGGGDLTFTVDVGNPPLTGALSLGSQSTAHPRNGDVVVSGTVSCSRPADAQLSARVVQTRGGAVVEGVGFVIAACDSDSPWEIEIEPSAGRFTGGWAEVTIEWFAFDDSSFVSMGTASDRVHLTGGRPDGSSAEVTSDIEYGFVDGAPLLLDLYEPSFGPRRHRPAVVYAHGGGFNSGSKTSGIAVDYATDLASNGVVAVSIDYRLSGSAIDAQHDTQAAVRWVRSNASSLGVDPDRIFVMGYSAGAIAALLASFRSDDPGESGNQEVLSDVAGAISLAGFVTAGFIDPGEPPILMFHGTADTTVPLVLGQNSCNATLAVGNSCDLQIYDGLGHFLESEHDEITERTLTFIGVGD